MGFEPERLPGTGPFDSNLGFEHNQTVWELLNIFEDSEAPGHSLIAAACG